MVRFEMLGTLRVVCADGPVLLRSAKQRHLLAVLLAGRAHAVSAARLIDCLWEGDPPRTAPNSLQVITHRLRGRIGVDRILHTGGGYRLEVATGEVDGAAFESGIDEARQARQAGDPLRASELFASTFQLWKGDPYGQLSDAAGVREDADRLTELWLAAVEEHFEVEIELGQHRAVVPKANVMVSRYPYREGLRGLLMRALAESGRAADALQVYRIGRETLLRDLGVEPGPELPALAASIRTNPAVAGSPALTSVPIPAPGRSAGSDAARLPPAPSHFTGRGQDVGQIVRQLTGPDPATVALHGPGGSGKSALAIVAAHTLADLYPDGVLYANLRATTPGVEPIEPGTVLAHFLRALGEPDPPSDPELAGGRFRTLTAKQRVLIVLDDVGHAAAIRPLLPGGTACGVLLTSRPILVTLDGVEQQAVGTLPEADAIALLGRLAGHNRLATGRTEALEVVRHCGGLPLALRIVGARLADHPDWSMADLAGRLADERARLDELVHGNFEVRGSIAVGLADLLKPQADLFALMGALELPTFTAGSAAALIGGTERDAESRLDRLIRAQLVQSSQGGHFDLHDLVRLFAAERAGELDESDRHVAVGRTLRWYIGRARAASRIVVRTEEEWLHVASVPEDLGLDRPMHDNDEVSAWVETEQENLVALVQHATHPAEQAALFIALYNPFRIRARWHEIVQIGNAVLPAAQQHCDLECQAKICNQLGYASYTTGDLDRAEQLLEFTAGAFRTLGGDRRRARAFGFLGLVAIARSGGNATDPVLRNAIEELRSTIGVMRETGIQHAGALLITLGALYLKVSDFDHAITAFEEGARIADGVSPQGRCSSLDKLAESLQLAGRTAEAIEVATTSLPLARDCAAPMMAGNLLWTLGDAHADLGDPELARAYWLDSASILRERRLIDSDEVEALLSQGRPARPGAYG